MAGTLLRDDEVDDLDEASSDDRVTESARDCGSYFTLAVTPPPPQLRVVASVHRDTEAFILADVR